jgi:hypothetical protein
MRFVRCKTTSNYEAMIITPEKSLRHFDKAPRTRTHADFACLCDWASYLRVSRSAMA